jgi:hypothetical protein
MSVQGPITLPSRTLSAANKVVTPALVIMGYGASAPLLHRQTRLGTIKRLNLALLVNRQDNGVAGRIDIEANDLVQFGGKLGIVGRHPMSVPAFMMSPEWSVNKAGALDGEAAHEKHRGRSRRDHRQSNG